MQSVVPQKSYYECQMCGRDNDFDDPVCIKCGYIFRTKKNAVISEMEELGFQAGESSYRLRQIAGFCIYFSLFSLYLYVALGRWSIWNVIPLCLNYVVFIKFYWVYKEEFSKIVISEDDFDITKNNENFAWIFIAISIIVGFGLAFF